MGSPGVIHDRTIDWQPVSWAWVQPQVSDLTNERSFDSQAAWVIGVLGLYVDVFHGCFYDRALADVRSNGAGIK